MQVELFLPHELHECHSDIFFFPSTVVSNIGMTSILPQQNSGIVFRKEYDK